jgi:hypothetical protein
MSLEENENENAFEAPVFEEEQGIPKRDTAIPETQYTYGLLGDSFKTTVAPVKTSLCMEVHAASKGMNLEQGIIILEAFTATHPPESGFRLNNESQEVIDANYSKVTVLALLKGLLMNGLVFSDTTVDYMSFIDAIINKLREFISSNDIKVPFYKAITVNRYIYLICNFVRNRSQEFITRWAEGIVLDVATMNEDGEVEVTCEKGILERMVITIGDILGNFDSVNASVNATARAVRRRRLLDLWLQKYSGAHGGEISAAGFKEYIINNISSGSENSNPEDWTETIDAYLAEPGTQTFITSGGRKRSYKLRKTRKMRKLRKLSSKQRKVRTRQRKSRK